MNSAEVLIKFKGDTKDAESKIQGLTKSITLGSLASKGISKAMQVFNQNLGSAVSRVDTLNNFTNVMSNLGVSADDSQEAIDTLSKKLDGLPTTINEGALAVQRFTAANGNVKKSTDIYLALNNALLAGGTSAETQSNAMEQLNQAYSKGKPDAMEWRTMLTAMPGQLKQVATELGYTSTAIGGDLQKALQDGSLSMDDFMEAFVKLNKEGTGDFKSFEEQERNSTAGISTGMKNMKTAIVRGMANAIQSVNKALKKYGGLAGVFKSIGKVAEKVFSKLGDILAKILPYLIKTAEWIAKHKKLIIALAAPIAGIIASIKTVQSVTGFLGNLAGTIKNLWGVISANPIAAVTGLVAGLTTGIVLWIDSMDKGKAAHKKAMEDLEKDSKAIKEETDSWKKLKDQRDETLTTGMREVEDLQGLRDELYNIVDANGKVKKGYEDRAKFITNELSQALGIEIEYKDGIIQGYQQIQEEIDKTIEKKKAEIILNASEEMYTEALKKQYKAEAKKEELREKLNQKQAQYNKLMEEGTGWDKIGASKKAKRYKEELEAAKKNYDAQEDLLNKYYFEIEQYDKNYAYFKKGQYDQMSTLEYNTYKQTAGKVKDAKKADLQAQIDQEQRHYNSLIEYAKKYGNDSVKTELENSKKKLDTLNKNLTDYENSTKTGLDKTKEKWSGYASEVITKLKGKKTDITSAGEYLLEGLKSGLTNPNKKQNILTGISNLGNNIISALKTTLKIKSPSREAMEIGSYFLQGFTKGIDSEKEEAFNDITSFGKEMIDKAGIMSNVSSNLNSNLNISGSLLGNLNRIQQPIIVNVTSKQDPLGRMVNDIKTFGGGAKNDYNYGKGS